jgi:hypothetical protein
MPINSHDEQDPNLPPPGSRWGAGAQSVLPYLTKTLRARPASAPEQGREARPAPEPPPGFTERASRRA